MIGSFLLSAALSIGQATGADPATDAAVPPWLPAPAPPPAAAPLLSMPNLPGDPGIPAAAPAPAAEESAIADDKAAPAPAAEPAPEAKPVEITAPLLPIPTPPVVPPAPAASTPPDRWGFQKLYQGTGLGVCLDTERISIYGWLQTSYTMSSVPNNNLPLSFNYRAWEPDLQQAWMRINRSVVTSGTTEPTWGFNVDLLYGTDYRFTLERGIWNKQLTDRDGLPATYGFDPIQFYAEAYIPTISRGLDIKVGRFYTPFGVESVEAVSTPLMSHTYTFANAPPFTHTGVLFTQNLPCNLVVQYGLVTGEDIFLDPADELTGILTVQYSRPGNRDIFKFGTIIDSGRFNPNDGFSGVQGNPNFNVYDFVWTHNFDSASRMVYNLECIYGWMYNIPDAVAANGDPIHIDFANWWGVVNYLQYYFCPELQGTARFEVFDDPQGVRTNTYPGATPNDAKGLYTALTLGVNYKPRRQPSGNGIIMIRPEIRYDYNWDSKPFDNAHHGLFTAGTDVILRW